MRIGVFAHAGNLNLGDEALIASVVQNVRRRAPNAALCGFTVIPRDTEERHQIPSFPIRRTASIPSSSGNLPSGVERPIGRLKQWVKRVPPLYRALKSLRTGLQHAASVPRELIFLIRSYRLLKGTDLLLVAGSQQLNDQWGAWGFPFTVFKWSVLARLVGTRVAFLSVGGGPLNSRLSRFFLRRALALAAYRSYRDTFTQSLVRTLAGPGDDPVVPDLVYSLRLGTPARREPNGTAPLVGANPMPYNDPRYWPGANSATYQRYVQTLAAFGDWLVGGGRRVRFFPTQLRADPLVIDDIRGLMTPESGEWAGSMVSGAVIASLEDLVREIGSMDLVVANRYHGILIALLLNKPVLALAYHQKSAALMAMMGQERYAIDLTACTTELLIDRFASLEARAETVKHEIAERVTALRESLERQYDRVFGLLNGKPVATG